jgi:hypothetical protein
VGADLRDREVQPGLELARVGHGPGEQQAPCSATRVLRASASTSVPLRSSPRCCMRRRPLRMGISKRAKPLASAMRAASSVSASSLDSDLSGQPPRQCRRRCSSTSMSRHDFRASLRSGSWPAVIWSVCAK